MSFLTVLKLLRSRVETRVETSFPSEAAKISGVNEPVRWGRRVLWTGGLLCLLWGAFAPLGQGVPTTGVVKVEGNRKTIQHLRGGVVEEILVREGDTVEANQPLIRLNETQVLAQRGMVVGQLSTLLAVEARLRAERAGKKQLEFPKILLERENQAVEKDAMRAQVELFAARRAALNGEIHISEESISGLEEQLRGLRAQEQSKAAQLKLYQEELESLKPLYEQGFVPRNKMFDLERGIVFLSGQRSEDLANAGRVRSQISELRLKILQARDLFRRDVETQLTDIQRQVADFQERRVATEDDLSRIILRAPVAGTVVDLGVHTVGGVVSPGQKLMDVVPVSQNLVVEVQIPPHLIDHVRLGLDADIRFSALDQTFVPVVPGKLNYVSADVITDQRTGLAYFVGRVVPTDEAWVKLGKHTVQAGMPADVVILTGERTLFGYLLKPLLGRMQFAFTER